MSDINIWDINLILSVTGLGCALAYLKNPVLKAAVLCLPIPFTMATMAVSKSIDITNVMGMPLLFLYMHATRILHYNLKFPIVIAIASSATLYCLSGFYLTKFLPHDAWIFWSMLSLFYVIGYWLYTTKERPKEQGHRSTLSPFIKAPVIAGFILVLILLKEELRGFITLFPMVGVVATYEARRSLNNISHQVPYIAITVAPMLATCKLLENHLSLGQTLIAAWLVFALVSFPIFKKILREM